MSAELAAWFDDIQRQSLEGASEATRRAHPPEQRMRGPEILEFLRERRLAGIATTRPNGLPHLTTNAFVMIDGDFWMPLMPQTARLENLKQTPYACLLITDGQGLTYTMLQAEGEVELVAEAPAIVQRAHVDKQASSVAWVEAWIHLRVGKLFTFAGEQSRFSGGKGFVQNMFT